MKYLILLMLLMSSVAHADYVIPKKANEEGAYFYFVDRNGAIRVCPSATLKKYFKPFYGCNETVSPSQFALMQGRELKRIDIIDDKLVITVK